MRVLTLDGYNHNSALLTEDPFVASLAPKRIGYCAGYVRIMWKHGRRSKLTGKIVQLECCEMPNGALGTSQPAFERFMRALNGA